VELVLPPLRFGQTWVRETAVRETANPDAIDALRRDIAISIAMGLNRVVSIDRLESCCGGPNDGSRLRCRNSAPVERRPNEGRRSRGKILS
jgi:hypothetical protein